MNPIHLVAALVPFLVSIVVGYRWFCPVEPNDIGNIADIADPLNNHL